jgi:hypothetical protein
VDSACQAIACNYTGIALGQSPEVELMINHLLDITSRVGSRITMSLDVTGWSPGALRQFYFKHHEVIKTLKKQFELGMAVLWHKIQIGIRKGGAKFLKKFVEGMVQGWTGRLASILHMHILIWITDLLKRDAQVRSTMGYSGACVIYDTLICYGFSGEMNRAAHAELAQTMCDSVPSIQPAGTSSCPSQNPHLDTHLPLSLLILR